MASKAQFTWIEFYIAFADALRPYAGARDRLIGKIKAVYQAIGMPLPTLEREGKVVDIDPFTVFGLFNKRLIDANRIAILRGFAREFGVKAAVPQTFDGIPVLNNQSATYYRFGNERGEHNIDNLWGVFNAALDYARTHSRESRDEFIKYYNAAIAQKGVKWNLSMGLYWIRPYEFLNLDSRNRWYIANPENMPADFVEKWGKLLDSVLSAEDYLAIIADSKDALAGSSYVYRDFPALSYYAWKVSEQVNQEERDSRTQRGNTDAAVADSGVDTLHYWIYAPGDNASMWDEFYREGIMAIGWGQIGDLRAFASKDVMKQMMRERIDASLSYKNAAHATWQFANEMKPGDIVFVKKGIRSIIGRGVVTSDYEFDAARSDDFKNVRRVNWTHHGEWAHPGTGQAAMKTLTDITPYSEYVKNLCALFTQGEEDVEERAGAALTYTDEDFLSEVYMSRADYETLSYLLRKKKNIILQGAPGVGKTKRLAYAMMGVKDPSRVMMVQFHQSYSYENFIMGFRPNAEGFELREGPFYTFCKNAEIDSENDYFFIIDEINRGNLSKIFGELFMLIENDKRGVLLQLLYADEKFTVPKNVYIIGMMNTAGRNLDLDKVDYALRRRFAFFDLAPAFQAEGFRRYRQQKNNRKFDRPIAAVERLNIAIEEDEILGKGFRIGHSFFHTEEDIDDRWLDGVIAYEIIPLLNEYWCDEPNKVRDWASALREAIR